MAKKAPKRAQADQPATESRGSAEPAANGEATATLPPTPPSELQRIQLLADTAGRIFRALTRWLTHEQKHMRVLGWITWLVLLVILGGFAVVLISHPAYTIAFIGGSTGLVACANLVDRFLRRKG